MQAESPRVTTDTAANLHTLAALAAGSALHSPLPDGADPTLAHAILRAVAGETAALDTVLGPGSGALVQHLAELGRLPDAITALARAQADQDRARRMRRLTSGVPIALLTLLGLGSLATPGPLRAAGVVILITAALIARPPRWIRGLGLTAAWVGWPARARAFHIAGTFIEAGLAPSAAFEHAAQFITHPPVSHACRATGLHCQSGETLADAMEMSGLLAEPLREGAARMSANANRADRTLNELARELDATARVTRDGRNGKLLALPILGGLLYGLLVLVQM